MVTVTGTHFIWAVSDLDWGGWGVQKPSVFVASPSGFQVMDADIQMQDCEEFYVGSRNYSFVQNCGTMELSITADTHADLNQVTALAIPPLSCASIEEVTYILPCLGPIRLCFVFFASRYVPRPNFVSSNPLSS